MTVAPLPRRGPTLAQQSANQSRLVHIIDDDNEVRESTSLLLGDLGYSTKAYPGGRAFLKEARLDRGCVLLDIYMPEMGGLEVLTELGARGSLLPVIMLSGIGDVQVAVRAMKLGAADFIAKPYEVEALAAAVENAFLLAEKADAERRMRARAMTKLSHLTPREIQILQGLRAGLANKDIARWLDLSPRTIESHRAKMMARIDAATFSELLRVAHEGGLPDIDIAAE